MAGDEYAQYGALALGGLSAGLGALQDKQRKKRAAELRKMMFEQIDAGASNASGQVARGARLASGNAAQSAINSGFYNSTVASDAASGVTQAAAGQLGDIAANAGRAKAQAAYDTFDTGGGVDLSGAGQALGYMLASRPDGGNETTTAGGASSSAPGKPSPMAVPGGPQEINSATFMGGPGGDMEIANMSQENQTMRSLMDRSRRYRRFIA